MSQACDLAWLAVVGGSSLAWVNMAQETEKQAGVSACLLDCATHPVHVEPSERVLDLFT